MIGLLCGSNPADLIEVQAALMADMPLAGGVDINARELMYYDRLARLGIAGFSPSECAELQAAYVMQEHGRTFCMLPTAAKRHAEMVELSRYFPIR